MPQNSTFNSQLRLNFVVFIWGFTAILGDLISLEALSLVWNRILIALVVLLLYFIWKKKPLKVDAKTFGILALSGVIIAAHWVTFFHAIKISNVSVTLVCLSSAAFFTSLLEPLFFRRKILLYEFLLGLVVIGAISMIFALRTEYFWGIVTALSSAFLSALFSVINGKLTHKHESELITFYELGGGLLALTIVIIALGDFNLSLLPVSTSDWVYLFILGSVCTAYPFIESVRVMRLLSPFTVMLSINLEPVYGIILAYLFLGEDEKMSPTFYAAALLIIAVLFANAWIRKKRNRALLKIEP